MAPGDATKELHGKRAVVFGGANGIGRACGKLLVERGAEVVIADIDSDGASEAVALLGDQATSAGVDVTDEDQVQRVLRSASGEEGGLNIVVHSVYADRAVSVTELRREDWDSVICASLTSAYLVAKASVPLLRSAGGGSITFVSSIQAHFGFPHEPAYAASKAGIIGLSRQVACEYARAGVRANCVLPSFVLTERERRRIEQEGQDLAAIADCFPLGWVGGPEEVAEAVVFLSSDRSRFITGIDILVDGGISIQPASYHLGRPSFERI